MGPGTLFIYLEEYSSTGVCRVDNSSVRNSLQENTPNAVTLGSRRSRSPGLPCLTLFAGRRAAVAYESTPILPKVHVRYDVTTEGGTVAVTGRMGPIRDRSTVASLSVISSGRI